MNRYPPQPQYDRPFDDEEDSGPGLGTLGAVLAAGALLSPAGAQARGLAKRGLGFVDEKLGGYGAQGVEKLSAGRDAAREAMFGQVDYSNPGYLHRIQNAIDQSRHEAGLVDPEELTKKTFLGNLKATGAMGKALFTEARAPNWMRGTQPDAPIPPTADELAQLRAFAQKYGYTPTGATPERLGPSIFRPRTTEYVDAPLDEAAAELAEAAASDLPDYPGADVISVLPTYRPLSAEDANRLILLRQNGTPTATPAQAGGGRTKSPPLSSAADRREKR